MGEYSEALLALTRRGETCGWQLLIVSAAGRCAFLGDVVSSPATVARLIRKLTGRSAKLHFRYEDGAIMIPGGLRSKVVPAAKTPRPRVPFQAPGDCHF